MEHRLSWTENGQTIDALWITESELPPPKRVFLAEVSLTPESFYQQASEGSAFIWRSDFQKAKDLLLAVQKRISKQEKRRENKSETSTEAFHQHRQRQAHRARLLSRLLIPIGTDATVELPRAPDVKLAISEAMAPKGAFLLSLRELLGMIGAHEWRKKGVQIPALGGVIYPYYGVYSPVRGEYLALIEKAPLPASATVAFEIGTGTGVVSALLAKRGLKRIIATEIDERALACAHDNLSRLGLLTTIELQRTDLFPEGIADLIVCNPPWLPARPTSAIERAVYDNNSEMLKGFLAGLAKHLHPTGEAWLIISDLAELLGLRKPDDLQTWIAHSSLRISGVLETRPAHPKSSDERDALFHARSRETTKLIRLTRIAAGP